MNELYIAQVIYLSTVTNGIESLTNSLRYASVKSCKLDNSIRLVKQNARQTPEYFPSPKLGKKR